MKTYDEIVQEIEKQRAAGVELITLHYTEVRVLMKHDLQQARLHVNEIRSMDFDDYLGSLRGGFGDGTFFQMAGQRFYIRSNGWSVIPSGEYSGSDINYYYFAMLNKMRWPKLGGLAGHAGNAQYNTEEAIWGDGGRSARPRAVKTPVPFNQDIGQIPRATPWVHAGARYQDQIPWE